MKLRANVCLLFFVLVLLGASEVWATKIIEMDPQRLAAASTAVVQGQVVRVGAFKNATGTKVFTETIIAVAQTHKGTPAAEVRLVQLGGEVDGVRVTVHGALPWTEGEEVVVFLEPYQDDSFHVAGFSQGKFLVERDARTGRAYVTRPGLPDVELVGDDGHAAAHGGDFARVPLEEFLTQALGTAEEPADR